MQLPSPIRAAIALFANIPSIGPRQATRIVFHILNRGTSTANELKAALEALTAISRCEECFFLHEEAGALCTTCANPDRTPRILLVVEKETDVLSIENIGKYEGRYFIIGMIPKTGTLEAWQKERLEILQNRIAKQQGKLEEIILGFAPTTHGNFSAGVIARDLSPFAKKITRLGRGLPTGGEIEFADDETLGSALEGRS